MPLPAHPLSRTAHLVLLLLLLPPCSPARAETAGANWRDALAAEIERIDRETPGSLGVYVKRLDRNEAFSHQAERGWYLGSTVKLPVAVAVLQQVDAGRMNLGDSLALQETDRVDGPGQLVWAAPGTRYTVDSLLTRMLHVSDNTAANLLMRRVGEDVLQTSARPLLGDGFQRITTMTDVRREVYRRIDADAASLSGRQLMEIARLPQAQRAGAVRRALGHHEAGGPTLAQAYADYYRSGVNTATLVGYGGMLEQLVRGKVLTPASTRRLFSGLKFDLPRGDYRLEGGLPKTIGFIHKTGTQYRRACHMGVVNPQDGGARAIVIATCAEDLDEQRDAGRVFTRVGQAVTKVLLQP